MSRPTTFTLNSGCSLATGLLFAGLGSAPGTTTYTDSSAGAHDGTLIGFTGAGNLPSDRWALDGTLSRYALGFNGATDYVDCGTPSSWTGVGSFTLAAWIYRDPSQSNGLYQVFGDNGASSVSGWGLQVYNDSERGMTDDGTHTALTGWASALTKGTWYHVAITYDSTSGVVTCYLNGADDGGTHTNVAGILNPGANKVIVGARNNGTGNWWIGKIADPMAWSRILTGTEITALADPANVNLTVSGTALISPPPAVTLIDDSQAGAAFHGGWSLSGSFPALATGDHYHVATASGASTWVTYTFTGLTANTTYRIGITYYTDSNLAADSLVYVYDDTTGTTQLGDAVTINQYSASQIGSPALDTIWTPPSPFDQTRPWKILGTFTTGASSTALRVVFVAGASVNGTSVWADADAVWLQPASDSVPSDSSVTLIAPNDARFCYPGRWNVDGTAATTINQGAGVTFAWTGPRCDSYWRSIGRTSPDVLVSLDGNTPVRHTLSSTAGAISLTGADGPHQAFFWAIPALGTYAGGYITTQWSGLDGAVQFLGTDTSYAAPGTAPACPTWWSSSATRSRRACASSTTARRIATRATRTRPSRSRGWPVSRSPPCRWCAGMAARESRPPAPTGHRSPTRPSR